MIWVFYVVVVLALIILATDLTLIISWIWNFKSYHFDRETYPQVSVLVAARNEEQNIESCLRGLLSVDYPKEKMEILVGNDDSTDNTLHIARALAKEDNRIKVFDIKTILGQARGKANVLAHLANQARGEFYFISDADTRVQTGWINNLLYAAHRNVGMISGVTVVGGETLWARLQNMEWLNAFGMLKVITDFNVPVTGIGNNMMITREAYEKVGGYENIPFSIVEDFQLTKAMLGAGFKVINLINVQVLATTKAVSELKGIFNQRKRWMHGALKIPVILKLILMAQALVLPVGLALFFYDFTLAISFLLLKILLRTTFTFFIYKKVKQKINFDAALLYDLYVSLLSVMTLLYFIIPVKVDWKGRKY